MTVLAILNYSNEALCLTIKFNLTTGHVRFQKSSTVLVFTYTVHLDIIKVFFMHQ